VFVNEFLTAVPMYNQRHGLRPGITGWGQIHYELRRVTPGDARQNSSTISST